MTKMINHQLSSLRIALVYDWLDTSLGGAEKVLAALSELYPTAPIYTAYQTPQAPRWLKQKTVQTSFLQKLPWLWKHKALLSVLLPFAFESFNFDQFDLVISISSFAAKGILTKPNQLHLCYLLTPTRFLYSHQEKYLKAGWLKLPLIKQIAQGQKKSLIRWDQVAAHRPDFIIPISHLVEQRSTAYYQIKTQPPLYPPVDATSLLSWRQKNQAQNFTPQPALPFTEFDLIVCRQVPYKRVDLAIKAAIQAQRPLIVVGNGPQHRELVKLATNLDPAQQWIAFLGQVNDQTLAYLYQKAQLFLMPGIEDFGITGLEAQIMGLPVLVHSESGVAELIPDQKAGFHLKKETVTAILEGYQWYQKDQNLISRPQIAKNALEYETNQFQSRFADQVKRLCLESKLWQQ